MCFGAPRSSQSPVYFFKMNDITHRGRLRGYRPDIDGLRAVAVLLVVFDHLQLHALRGGYVGVDVFFVISGYLIGAILIAEMAAGRFSILDFYERRVRRIFPALLVVLSVCLLFTLFLFTPSELSAFVKTMLTALAFSSNYTFWRQAGYFEIASNFKPLLHTWSLAVEEQFYIVFPLLLAAIHRWWPQRLRAVLWAMAVLSFGLAVWQVQRSASTAFFLAPYRAWEFLLGVLLAQGAFPAIRAALWRNVWAAVGLAGILLPGFFYTAQTPFPGWAALPPCLGAVLFIAAGDQGESWAGRALSTRPIVFVGLISYSLYLCHWPVIVFQNTNRLFLPVFRSDWHLKAVLLFASLVLGALSWRLVEAPFRKGRLRPARRPLFLLCGSATLVLVAAGGSVLAARGLPGRLSAQQQQVAQYINYVPGKTWGNCFIGPMTVYQPSACLRSDPHRKNYLLFGDSLAAQLYPGLVQEFPEINLLQATVGGCSPTLKPHSFGDEFTAACTKLSRYIFDEYLPNHPVDAVLLASTWRKGHLDEVTDTIVWLQQRHIPVIVFGPTDLYVTGLPALLVATHGRPADVAAAFNQDTPVLDRTMASMAATQWHVRYISLLQDLCNPQAMQQAGMPPETVEGCPLYAAPGVPLLFDTHHMTPQASVLYVTRMRLLHQLP